MTVEISKEFINCLKKSHDINESLRICAGEEFIRTRQENKTSMMVSPIDVKFERDINIYALREFISVLSIVDGPVLDLSKDSIVTVKSKDGKQKLRYIECDPNMVSSHSEKDPELKRVEMTIDITEEQFTSVVNAAKVMNLPYVGFDGDGVNINLVAFNRNDGDEQDTNSYSIEICESPTEDSFSMYFDLAINKPSVLLNEGSLEVSISSNPKAVKVETESGKTFFLAFSAKSKYGI